MTGQVTRCQVMKGPSEGKAGDESGMRLDRFHRKNSSLVEGQRLEM